MPTIDFPTIDLRKLELPFQLPFELPVIDLPTVQVPDVDLPSADQVIELIRDAAFASVGLVALTAQRAAELQKQLVDLVKDQVERVQRSA